jgi:hypothetical protein
MDNYRRIHIQELERLRIELAKAGQLLDELERRQGAKEQKKTAADLIVNGEINPNDPETRFAAYVSRGLAKRSST